MAGLSELIEGIAEVLWANVSAPHLPAICTALGLLDGDVSESYSSKRAYVRKRIVGLSKDDLVQLAIRIHETYPSESIQCLIEQFAPERSAGISDITRQHLFTGLSSLGPIEGKLELLDFLGKLWPLTSMPASGSDSRCHNAHDEICQHMLLNNDYSYSQLFELLGLAGSSNKKLFEFLEWTVHPMVRVDAEQDRYVEVINNHLRHDGLVMFASDQVSGYPLFRVMQIVDGVSGSAKNLIFASTGPKPEIVFTDALNNDIKIVKNSEFCLVYDLPLSKDGLLWRHLVAWWAVLTDGDAGDPETERNLYRRLYQSLESPPEQLLFRTFFESFRSTFGEQLPALIPQVYLHFDPFTARMLGGEKRLPRQRMDFLLLFSTYQRVVIEVDGKHHYSEGDASSPPRYAEMVSADRDIRLLGYEVYRFGGAELADDGGRTIIEMFFSRLFDKHGIRRLGRTKPVGDG